MATTSNVTASKPAVGGAVSVGAANATLPTSASATATGFTSLGYISEDGLKHNISPTSEQTKAWGGDIVMSSISERSDEFTFTLIESTNVDVLKLVYGDANVTGTLATGITVSADSANLPAKKFIIDMVLRDNAVKRICIPNAVVSGVGEITYNDSDAVGYEITLTAMPDASGKKHYEYITSAASAG